MKGFLNLTLVLLTLVFLVDKSFSQENQFSSNVASPLGEKPVRITADHLIQEGGKEDQHSPTVTSPPAEKPVRITADHLIQESEKNLIRAWGKVEIQMEDRILRADKVQINNKTGFGKAVGNVLIIHPDGTRIKAKSSRFNIKTKQGELFNSRGRIAKNYFVEAKKITRYSETHYKLTEASLTTCTGKIPDWKLEANWIDLKDNDRALFTGGVFKVKNIPILYIPAGYLPINRKRKSGFLFPSYGSSAVDGLTIESAYFWAINRWSDATVNIDYIQNRGIRPRMEYRYIPSHTTRGIISASYLEDEISETTLWKVDMAHQQKLPYNFDFTSRLDLESEDSFNKAFEDDIEERSRQSTDSFVSLSKIWSNSSLDMLARFRDSTNVDNDDTFGLLPQITYKTQRQLIGSSPFYFNQDASFTGFHIDLNSDPVADDDFVVRRIDFHPQISLPIPIAPWMSITPTVGVRETFYSKGLDSNDTQLNSFSRELFDINAVVEGPKFSRVFHSKSSRFQKLKHLIEPRVSYSFIPDLDKRDRDKIRTFDAIDTVGPQSLITYSLTQRFLQKDKIDEENSQIREILRFGISQSFDFREATRTKAPGTSRRPFSTLRFDLDSRLIQPLILNMDATLDTKDDLFTTLNFEVGYQPMKSLSMFLERRWVRDGASFTVGTLDWAFKKGWRFLYSTRFDEETQTFRENDFSLLYDNKCRCWGFSLEVIDRQIRLNKRREDDTKFIFTLHLRGIGNFRTSQKRKLNHRSYLGDDINY